MCFNHHRLCHRQTCQRLYAPSAALPTCVPCLQIVVSVAEHHANMVPWHLLCEATGATLKHVRLNANEEVDMDHLATQVTEKTKLVALVHVSNVLGSVLPTAQVAEVAHNRGAKVLLDCCQSVPHMPVDVQARLFLIHSAVRCVHA